MITTMCDYHILHIGALVLHGRNVAKDAPTWLSNKEYAFVMARSMHLLKLAAIKDVTTMLRKEEYVLGMERQVLNLQS